MNEIEKLHLAILKRDASLVQKDLKSSSGLSVYLRNYYQSLFEVVNERYPKLLDCLGEAEFRKHFVSYIDQFPTTGDSIDDVGNGFWEYLEVANKAIAELAKIDFYFTKNLKSDSLKVDFEKNVLRLYLNDEINGIESVKIAMCGEYITVGLHFDADSNLTLQ